MTRLIYEYHNQNLNSSLRAYRRRGDRYAIVIEKMISIEWGYDPEFVTIPWIIDDSQDPEIAAMYEFIDESGYIEGHHG